MKLTLKSVLLIVCTILYVVLLPWPLYVLLPFLIFAGWVKIVVILLTFAVEFALGIFLIVRKLKRPGEIKKIGSKILFGLLAGSFLIYAVTAIIYLVQVLINVL